MRLNGNYFRSVFMTDEHLIPRLAEEAVNETQLLMIMDYRSFESELYHTFARKIIEEVQKVILAESAHHTVMYDYSEAAALEKAGRRIKEHFNIREKTAVPLYRCCDCNEEAVWTRVTQYSGTHHFCDKHARMEENFGVWDSSYFHWVRI